MNSAPKVCVAILGVLAGCLPAARAQTLYPLNNIYTFRGGVDGSDPASALTQGTDGNFYGTTEFGSTIFRLTPTGVLTTLYAFDGRDGSSPDTPLIESNGFFYGATAFGGPDYRAKGPSMNSGCGTIFRLGPDGELKTLAHFEASDRHPISLVLAPDGNFYGTTSTGISPVGESPGAGSGVVFRVSPDGTLKILHSFRYNLGPLVAAQNGYLYGAVTDGGAHKAGSVFRISTNGEFTSIYDFTAAPHQQPRLQFQGADGAFYGIIGMIDNQPSGDIFRLTGKGEFSILHSFNFHKVGNGPAVLIKALNGNFYGTAGQTNYAATPNGEVITSNYLIYELTPGGVVTPLRRFINARIPATLFQATDGNLYCTEVNKYYGGVFRINLTP
jgi:uncharacterized repeat protein (TIGR03803 family)